MTITLGHWILPSVLTLTVWIAVRRKCPPRIRGDYDFGVDYLFFWLIGLIATLAIWLAYFAYLLWLRR